MYQNKWKLHAVLILGATVLYGTIKWVMKSDNQLSSPNNSSFCDDPDQDTAALKASACPCRDPLRPLEWPDPEWHHHHKTLVERANAPMPGDSSSNNNFFDLVILGDSITERLNGTRHLGTIELPENRNIFESLFTKAGGGSLEALALGSSGDTSTNLLWHLQHGMLPAATSTPKVWMLLIGTNDLGRTGCSKQTTLQGIINVIQYLQQKRPQAKILVHGMLPRSEISMAKPMTEENYSIGRFWDQIQWINLQLKDLCEQNANLIYMEAPQVFLLDDKVGRTKINPQTMPDGLHPSAQGLRQWGPLIVKRVLEMI